MCDEKRKQWETIQDKAPLIGNFIQDFSVVFEGLEAVQVEIAGNVVVDTFRGGFQNGSFVPDMLTHKKAKTGVLRCYWGDGENER